MTSPPPPFPEQGRSNDDEILAELQDMGRDDLKSDGKTFAFVYSAGKEVNDLARKAFAIGMPGNGLDPTVYPSARRLENDLVAIGLEHLRAPEGACGTVTTGGTESVILAVKSARQYARKTKPHITKPNMLVPITAHACLQKAAHYLDIELIPIDVDSETMQASMGDYAKKINENTILLVGSAPSYAHGVIDPIEELGKLAQKHEVLLHVDACIGGWVLPFQRDIGIDVAAFDFQVPGVTSISVDLHKYGFTPKGISLLLQRNRDLRDAQYYTCASWTGYSVINTTILGSKSIAPMAAAWAVLQKVGKEGYRSRVRDMWDATQKLVAGVTAIPGLRIIGTPSMGLVAITTVDGDIFELSDRVSQCGWHLQPTYEFENSPAHIHFSIDPSNASQISNLLEDLREQTPKIGKPQEPPAAVVQMLELVAQGGGGINARSMMAEFGIADGKLPGQQAQIHRLINGCSPKAREALLTLFFGEMFS